MLRIRKKRGIPQLLLNGELLLDDVSLVDPGMIELLDRSELKKFEKCTFTDLDDFGIELKHLFQLPALSYLTIIPPITLLPESRKDEFTIEYYFFTELRDWKKPYSFAEYTEALSRISKSRRIPNLECLRCDSSEQGELEDSLNIKFTIWDPAAPIGPEIRKTFRLVSDICSEAISGFSIRSTTALTTAFDFPKEVQTPCEQYLLYFVELLRQLGVHATAKLEHETDRVVFSVYPPNDPQKLKRGSAAVKKLRTALELFIHLPSSTLEGCESTHDHITEQLLANIDHLKTQLVVRQTAGQTEQLIPDPQLLANDSVRQSFRLRTFGSPQKREQLLRGLDFLTLDKAKGFKVNLPKMYHWLKDLA